MLAVSFSLISKTVFQYLLINLLVEFCPADCDWEKEMMCPGKMEPQTGEKMSPDYCIPNKIGDCANFCLVECDWEKQIMCPGQMEPNGCKMPDSCHHGSM